MLTVDASVWVAAADRADSYHTPSRQFLVSVAHRQQGIYLPSLAWIEIACALARRRGNGAVGRQLASAILRAPLLVRIEVDQALLEQALALGTSHFLRGADALYAATAALHGTQLVTWDNELIRRAGAVTPVDWLAANP